MRLVSTISSAPLYSIETTRTIEELAKAGLLPFTLMARAGEAVAQLASALMPHARCIWVACGPGNNGGDGLVAATCLHQRASRLAHPPQIVVTLDAEEARMPADAAHALKLAREAGVQFATHAPANFDLAIDALLGVGARGQLNTALSMQLEQLSRTTRPVLCVDLPSGLNANTGTRQRTPQAGPRHTLSLLTLKPGLFMADGRDACGQIWYDDLGAMPAGHTPTAQLQNSSASTNKSLLHASHKGTFGEVVVIGGQHIATHGTGMTGAAVLAARAALHGGAGRVYVGLLEAAHSHTAWDTAAPELMFRRIDTLLPSALLEAACTVCGCGGGDAVTAWLPTVLNTATCLVLDADALNAIARSVELQDLVKQRRSRGWTTVLTPHPLEAARLLGTDTHTVMDDRLRHAHRLSHQFQAVVVLKGSGTVVAAPHEIPRVNASGNAALATAGTGDVLAGWIGSALAHRDNTPIMERVAQAVHRHGWLADEWLRQHPSEQLTAGRLATATC